MHKIAAQSRGLGMLAIAGCGVTGCDQDACVEDAQAQVLAADVRVRAWAPTAEGSGPSTQAPAVDVMAEWADEPTQRDRGWRHRRCGREALVLAAPGAESLPIWGCELVDAIDVAFISEGQVVAVVEDLAPCAAPCEACPIVGADVVADHVLELPAGRYTLSPAMLLEFDP